MDYTAVLHLRGDLYVVHLANGKFAVRELLSPKVVTNVTEYQSIELLDNFIPTHFVSHEEFVVAIKWSEQYDTYVYWKGLKHEVCGVRASEANGKRHDSSDVNWSVCQGQKEGD